MSYYLSPEGLYNTNGTVVSQYTQNGIKVNVDASGKYSAYLVRYISEGGYPSCPYKKAFWRPLRFHMPSSSFRVTIMGAHRGMSGSSGYHEHYIIDGMPDSDQVGFRVKNESSGGTYVTILLSDKTGAMPASGSQSNVVLYQIGQGYTNVDLCLAITPNCGASKVYYMGIEWWGNSGDFTVMNHLYYANDSNLSNGPDIIGNTD